MNMMTCWEVYDSFAVGLTNFYDAAKPGFPIIRAIASFSGPFIVIQGVVCDFTYNLWWGSSGPWWRFILLISVFFKLKPTHFIMNYIA
jgi:hypothetical protein